MHTAALYPASALLRLFVDCAKSADGGALLRK